MTFGRSSKTGFEVHPPRLYYGRYVSINDKCFVDSSWDVILAISRQVTLRGNIDYGLQAYQPRLKATIIVRS